MQKAVKIIFILVLCVLFDKIAYAEGKIDVFVSIAPQKYFVEKIAQNQVEVSVMVQPGASPATYEPKPKQMIALSKTKIYFAIGVPFERVWLKKIAAVNPNMQIINTHSGIRKIPMETYHQHEREHHKGAYNNIVHDPHIWLSPNLVKIQARNMLNALLVLNQTNKSVYKAGYKKFIAEIDSLDVELKTIFTGKKETKFMVFHPSWGYFANEYGLKQIPVEIEGKNPKPSDLVQLIKHANALKIKIIFVQPQFSSASAGVIAQAIGGQIAFADPLALNWAHNLRQVAAKFKTALR
ncbi:MAG: zinc ABC transporter substrate-binding protein [Deltaproteobacteria bacterium]|nr:zinc ABC transporter substrate-binding protein [Deltaproteobacteria bacterium]